MENGAHAGRAKSPQGHEPLRGASSTSRAAQVQVGSLILIDVSLGARVNVQLCIVRAQ